MAKNRIVTSVFLAAGLTVALVEIGCSFQSDDRRRQRQAALEEYGRQQRADSQAADRQRAEEFKRMIADPGSLTIQESDAEIEALHSPSSLQRLRAAERLGDAKGKRAVDALVADLRTEKDPAAFMAVAQALTRIADFRATDALVEAMSAPNMPDNAREQAFNAIVEFRSDWRYVPQIQKFYDSLTDESVRARVRLVVERYNKK